MLIEIRGAGFINKGAELMLYAVLQAMEKAYPDARIVMAPTTNKGSAPFLKRAELGLLQKAWLRRYGMQWGDLAALVPRRLREMYGVVLDRDIDIVLDASGFAYTDQWGLYTSRELAQSCKRWRKRNTKLILLPQAFGPFKSHKSKELIKSVADNADLIFPRDRISYQHLTEAVGERQNIKIAPDFTNLIEGVLPDSFNKDQNRFCIVPNYRMIDKTLKSESEAYVPFMTMCTQYLIKKGRKPFILIHEGANDLLLADKIKKDTGGGVAIIKESHPLRIKGILGACEGTISSRYHGLVSALSQGVPSLATGWSHKYQELFEDYGFRDGLLDVSMDEVEVCKRIDLILNDKTRNTIIAEINKRSRMLKVQSNSMWEEVLSICSCP